MKKRIIYYNLTYRDGSKVRVVFSLEGEVENLKVDIATKEFSGLALLLTQPNKYYDTSTKTFHSYGIMKFDQLNELT